MEEAVAGVRGGVGSSTGDDLIVKVGEGGYVGLYLYVSFEEWRVRLGLLGFGGPVSVFFFYG